MAVSPPDSVRIGQITHDAINPKTPPDGKPRAVRALLHRMKSRRWWQEVLLVASFYAVYSAIRDVRGSRPVSIAQAFHNARRVIGFERTFGLFHEAQIQHVFLGHRFLVRMLDDWYGSTHFVVTAAVLAVLFFAYPSRYRLWRDILAAATALALIGFAFFPLMPPRLLPAHYGFTDTLQAVGGLWNFNSGPINHVSDQYAAMPSLHFAWALWCAMAVAAVSQRAWQQVLVWCYPAVTLVCVLVTANHYLADTAAGALIVLVGYGTAKGLDNRRKAKDRPPVAAARS